MPGLLVIVYGGGIILLSWLVMVLSGRLRHKPVQRPWLEPAALFLIALLVVSGSATYVRFTLSKPALSRYVAQAQTNQTSHRVGLFVVHETEVIPHRAVRLITTSCMFDECGFAYTDLHAPPKIGEDSYHPIATGWWVWERSW